MLSQCLVPSITKKGISYLLVLGQEPVLWLKSTQTVEMKENKIFSHGTYSNLTPYLFLSKNILVFQWLSKSKFLSFMTEAKPNNENETKSDFTFKSGIISFLSKNIQVF